MIDIVEELEVLVTKLDEQQIEYALCGGMAVGIHGFARTAINIDLLILAESLDAAIVIARNLDYTIGDKDLSFKDGTGEIRRISKIDPDTGDLLPLDFLSVTPPLLPIWESRIEAEWERGKLSVVTRDGLINLKRLRNSRQDLADIEALTGDNDV